MFELGEAGYDEDRRLTPEEAWAQLTGGGGYREEDDVPLDDLDLPTYVHSVLTRAGIETVGELLDYTPETLLGISGFGQKSLEEVRARLEERGWSLQGDLYAQTGDGYGNGETEAYNYGYDDAGAYEDGAEVLEGGPGYEAQEQGQELEVATDEEGSGFHEETAEPGHGFGTGSSGYLDDGGNGAGDGAGQAEEEEAEPESAATERKEG
jgi:hypothetical protein